MERTLLDQFRLDVGRVPAPLARPAHAAGADHGDLSPSRNCWSSTNPPSGLDPIVRREFIQTVIGAYQDGDPGRRTVFVSTHLIAEFEGLIDRFTIIDQGRDVLTLDADMARARYQKIYARFTNEAATTDLPGAHCCGVRAVSSKWW